MAHWAVAQAQERIKAGRLGPGGFAEEDPLTGPFGWGASSRVMHTPSATADRDATFGIHPAVQLAHVDSCRDLEPAYQVCPVASVPLGGVSASVSTLCCVKSRSHRHAARDLHWSMLHARDLPRRTCI